MGFKVIIVGGSITGLGLANMLEHHGIDYILLEAYPEIAPQVGASIALAPNGLRIMDQLGCYERIRSMAGNYYTKASIRDLRGRQLFLNSGPGLAERYEQQTGYPLLFMDRQMLLQVLFDKIDHKTRIMTGKRVIRVEMNSKGPAQVYTQDGSIFTGDILVGADGIHSAVRAEMWRLAGQICPSTFPADEGSQLKAQAKCIFGISKIPTNLPSTIQHTVSSHKLSYMAAPGPDGRLYWFMFVSMPLTKGTAIPRWSKQDEEDLAKQHFGDKITDKVNFGDIYKNRYASALVSLEEHVFKRWYFKRIITIGDSAHKVHPLTALGGNGAIESAALLCNALSRKLEQRLEGLSDTDIEEVFADVQARHMPRAQHIVKEGEKTQRWFNQIYPFPGFALKYLLPLAGENIFFGSLTKVCLEAPRIDRIPIPNRPHTTPFRDEIPVQTKRPGFPVWSVTIALAVGTAGYF